ncbi:MAG TPA: DUF2782 domain-containing protein [Xanthomonadaceae bacterium]|nr:DUF2782 domain-containing protein [Xanthomonadaceae bacterium]
MRIALTIVLLTAFGLAVAQTPTQTRPAPPTPVEEELPEKVPPPDEEAPQVTIRRVDGDVVEEYRQDGRLYMVRVTPRRGVPYTLMDTNGDGRLDSRDGDGPVRPVYYTIYEWD